MTAVRKGDALVVTKLDRLARPLPDARDIADELTRNGVSLSLGGSVYDPIDSVGRLLFNALGMVAEFEADLIRTHEGTQIDRCGFEDRRLAAAGSRARSALASHPQRRLTGEVDASPGTGTRPASKPPIGSRTGWLFGGLSGQKRAMAHGNGGKYGIVSNVESVSYRNYRG
jgi:Resolvase, N terminal domain